jgi:hypothetical protein
VAGHCVYSNKLPAYIKGGDYHCLKEDSALFHVGLGALTAVTMKNTIFWGL